MSVGGARQARLSVMSLAGEGKRVHVLRDDAHAAVNANGNTADGEPHSAVDVEGGNIEQPRLLPIEIDTQVGAVHQHGIPHVLRAVRSVEREASRRLTAWTVGYERVGAHVPALSWGTRPSSPATRRQATQPV